MFGLPENFDANGFIGKTLEIVTFGQYNTSLTFSDGYLVDIEGKISINSGAPVDLPDSLPQLYPLINHTIQRAQASANGTLTLIFENETALHILDSNDHFESYQLTLGSKELIVV
jgi:hypothetical protein